MPPSSVKEPERLGDFPPLEAFTHANLDKDYDPPLEPELPQTKLYLYDTSTPRMISDVAQEKEIGLICMAATSQRSDLTWWSAGKTVERVIERAPCSVLCLRGRSIKEKEWKRPVFRHVALLTELGEQRAALIERVIPLVKRFHSALHIFPMQSGHHAESGEQTALRELCQLQDVNTNVLLFSDPKNRMQNLMSFVNETSVDLIVMTPRTRARFSNRLVSDIFVRLIRLAKCPVLLLR
jgi:nucleotide-binding universal stress UspA family protein